MAYHGDRASRIGVAVRPFRWLSALAVVAVPLFLLSGCGPGHRPGEAETLIVYSGRSEPLIQPLIDVYREQTGVDVRVRYGQTAEMAATILEEGRHSPADILFAQDAGALGALARENRLIPLPADLLDRVDPRFRSPDGVWVGVSGRARVVVYNPRRLSPQELPASVDGLLDPAWRGRIGWAPPNGSFQAFVTAMRMTRGESAAQTWLLGMRDNRTRNYARNTPILFAVASGEIDVGLSNHYYAHQLIRERGDEFPVRNHYLDETLVNIAGVAIVNTSPNRDQAEAFIRFLLEPEAQAYFTHETFEYPLAREIEPNPALPPLRDLQTPDLDLSNLDDLDGTLRLLMELNLL